MKKFVNNKQHFYQQNVNAEIKPVRHLKYLKPKNQPFLGFTFLDKKKKM